MVGLLLLSASIAGTTRLPADETEPLPAEEPNRERDLWHGSYDEALRAGAESKKPVLVDFKAEWCGPCKKLTRETFGDERVIKLLRERFVAVQVDVDEKPDLAMKHGVESLPTVLFLSPGGDEIHRVVGFRPPETFIDQLGKVIGSSAAFETIKKEALDRPDDVDAQRAYARALLAAGNDVEAVAVLEKVLGAHPDDAGLHLDLADLHMSAGRLSGARDHYARVAAGDAKNRNDQNRRDAIAAALLPLARCQLGLGDEKGSLVSTARYLEDFAKDRESEKRHEARFLRGYAYARLKDTAKAVAELESVVEAAPESPWGLRAAYILDLVVDRQVPDSEG